MFVSDVFVYNISNYLCFQVCERPIMHLLDTPGVLPPKIESVETGMKLALCGKHHGNVTVVTAIGETCNVVSA